MADFPTSPTVGQVYTLGNLSWAWNGSAWDTAAATTNLAINAQTASYVLVLADKDRMVEMSVAGANTVTIPLNSSVGFPIGSQINILQTGAGQTSVIVTCAGGPG